MMYIDTKSAGRARRHRWRPRGAPTASPAGPTHAGWVLIGRRCRASGGVGRRDSRRPPRPGRAPGAAASVAPPTARGGARSLGAGPCTQRRGPATAAAAAGTDTGRRPPTHTQQTDSLQSNSRPVSVHTQSLMHFPRVLIYLYAICIHVSIHER